MASKKDLRSYFNVVSEKKKKKDSAVSISEIIVSETSDVSQAEVDMAREQVKKQVMQRKSYQVVPEKVKIEVGRYAANQRNNHALFLLHMSMGHSLSISDLLLFQLLPHRQPLHLTNLFLCRHDSLWMQ